MIIFDSFQDLPKDEKEKLLFAQLQFAQQASNEELLKYWQEISQPTQNIHRKESD